MWGRGRHTVRSGWVGYTELIKGTRRYTAQPVSSSSAYVSVSHTPDTITHDGVSRDWRWSDAWAFCTLLFETMTTADSSPPTNVGRAAMRHSVPRCLRWYSVYLFSSHQHRVFVQAIPSCLLHLPALNLGRQRSQTLVLLTKFDARDIITSADVQSRGLPTYYGSGTRRRQSSPCHVACRAMSPKKCLESESDVVQPSVPQQTMQFHG